MPAADWFVKIISVHTPVCRCLHVWRLLITSGMMWCDINPYDRLNKIYGFYMAAVVGIIVGVA